MTRFAPMHSLLNDSAGSTAALPSQPQSPHCSCLYISIKRVIDIVGSLALLVVTAPLLLGAALGVRASSAGPSIFKQRRVTQGGRVFTMYKLRTMHLHVEQGSSPAFTEENDPRVFPLGRFLRRTHIDEIPQLLNVLRGEMSLIGPRPERPEFLPHLREQFPGFDRRLELRAGITGLAQTTSGYADNLKRYRRKLHLDRIYIERCCLGLDLFIVLKTIGVLFTGAGAR